MCCVMPPASPATTSVADRVEQLGLTVVDVTHDGDDRRTRLQGVLVLAVDLGVEVDVEGLEQLAVLVLGGDDLDVVAELGAEQLEGVLVERLGGRGHLAEVEQHRTSDAGLASIFSAKSVSDAPRGSRTISPSPRGTCTPPIVGACRLSNSWRRCLRDLRPRCLPPPRPKAPRSDRGRPGRPPPPGRPAKPPPPPGAPPGRPA